MIDVLFIQDVVVTCYRNFKCITEGHCTNSKSNFASENEVSGGFLGLNYFTFRAVEENGFDRAWGVGEADGVLRRNHIQKSSWHISWQ
jgi:hypothetical protein